MNWQKIVLITSALIGIAGVFTIGFKVDSYYAHADEVRNLVQQVEYTNARLEQKIINDEIRQLTQRSWQLSDRLSNNPNDVTAREQLRITNQMLKELQLKQKMRK